MSQNTATAGEHEDGAGFNAELTLAMNQTLEMTQSAMEDLLPVIRYEVIHILA